MCSAILYCNQWTNGWPIMRANQFRPITINLMAEFVLSQKPRHQLCAYALTTIVLPAMDAWYWRSLIRKGVNALLSLTSISDDNVARIKANHIGQESEGNSFLRCVDDSELSGLKLSEHHHDVGARFIMNCTDSRHFILRALLKLQRLNAVSIFVSKSFDNPSTKNRQRFDKVSTSKFDKEFKQGQIGQGVEMILSTLHKKCTKTLKHRHTNTQDNSLLITDEKQA